MTRAEIVNSISRGYSRLPGEIVKGKLRMFVGMFAVLAGCTVPDAVDQADLIVAAYERDYGDVSDSEVGCLHDVTVRYARHDHVDRCDSQAIGCTVTGPFNTRIWIAQGLEADAEIHSLRHEYTHVLLWCMDGDLHNDHNVPEFGFSPTVHAPGSLSWAVDTL
jgi:hypothetical protein